jgi:hypothetical protein
MYKFSLFHEQIGREFLKDAPKGWENFKLTIARDAKYHGCAIKFTVDLDWITQGKAFITSVYQQLGIRADITVVIHEYIPDINDYVEAYTGQLNLDKLAITEQTASCNVEERNFMQLIFNSEDIELDLFSMQTLSGKAIARETPFLQLQLHSKAIPLRTTADTDENQAEYQIITDKRVGIIYTSFDKIDHDEFNTRRQDGDEGTGINKYNTGISFEQNQNPIIEFTTTGKVTLEYAVNVEFWLNSEKGDFDYARLEWWFGFNEANIIWSHKNTGVKELYNETIFVPKTTLELDVKPGDKLYFYGFITVQEVSGNFQLRYRVQPNVGTYIHLTGATTTESSPAKGLLAYEAFDRMVHMMTGRPNSFYSELLGRTDSEPRLYGKDGDASLTWLSNGFQIRQFPLKERTISTSFKEAYDALDAIWNVGMGPEIIDNRQVLRIEKKAHFYRDEVVLELGPVSNLKKEVATGLYYNEAEFGYSKWQNNQDGTLDEFNTKTTRTLPDGVKGKYSAIGKWIASGYTIEATRREQYKDSNTKDASNDKEIFVVRLTRYYGIFTTLRNQDMEISGVLDPDSIYNIDITPTRNLFRHGNMLSAGLLHEDNENLFLQPGEANFKVSCKLPGETKAVAEDMLIKAKDLERPLWLPEYYTFDYPIRTSERKLLEANPYGTIVFRDIFGNKKKGYLINVDCNPFSKETGWKLIRKYEE